VTVYATVDDVVAVLGLRAADVNMAALQRVLDAVTVQVDVVLDRTLEDPLPVPPPPGVTQATAQAAADLYAAQATRWGQWDSGDPDMGVIRVPRDPLITVEHLLAPYARSHGVG
jgi:hypothetical protein